MLHIYRQIRALRDFDPVVFCQKRENADAFPFERLEVVPKPATHQLRRWWQKTILGGPIVMYRSEALRLASAIERAGSKVLHIYFGHIAAHLLPLMDVLSIPIVVSFHGADAQVDLGKPAHLAAVREVLRKARRVLVRSRSIADRLRALGCDEGKLRLHGAGLPLGEIAFLGRLPPPGGQWRCVQTCRLIPKKGLRTTLRAFAEFKKDFPQATLTIAGEGPMLGELRALADGLGVGEAVDFAGFLPQESLRGLLARSHLFLHPSEMGADGDQEGIPNSMLEAMAGGLPVAATRHGGIPEAIEEGVSGLLSDEGDAAGLAANMRRLASSPELCERIGRTGSENVRRHFDIEAQTRVLEGIYRECLPET